MSYFFWIPMIALLYFLQSWLTVQSNTFGGKWSWIFFFVSLFTPWVLVSKYSKDVVFDALIFDVVLILTYSIGLLYFTNGLSKLSYVQYIGGILIFVGIILFKKGI